MATREELKAILDEWIPKYIRQVVELRSGSRLSAERYNELMNLLITQGDDTIELAETVKQYMEILVDELSNDFVDTTESLTQALNDTTARVTAIAEDAVDTAESAVSSVNQYKTTMDEDMEQFKSTTDADIRNFKNSINTDVEQFKNTVNNTVSQMSSDIVSFKESVTQSIADSDAKVNSAVETANQLTADMEAYRTELTQLTEKTFTDMQTALSQQVSDDVAAGVASLKDELIADINTTISALEEQVMTVANTAEQVVNSAVQDIESYKQNMDVRLDAALKEEEDSLSVAGEIIQDASAIYAKINEIDELVNSYEGRLTEVENPTFTIADANAELTSGEKLSTAFGKIARAIRSLFSHLTDTVGHITSAERTTWNNKAGTSTATTSANGLMSSTDKSKLDNIATGANNYSHPNSGVTAGTYHSVTVNAQGHVTGGSNPTVTVAQGGTGKTSIRDTLNSYFPTQLSAITSIPILGANWENNGYVPLATLKSALGSMPASDVYSWAKASAKPSYSWSEITSKPTTFTPSAHTHTKSQITDFPTSLPASDVYAWAKASAKPTYTWSEITSKPTSFTPAAHNQSASTITAGTFAGQVVAPAGTDYTTNRVRNSVLTTTDPGAGVSVSYANGSTIDVYE